MYNEYNQDKTCEAGRNFNSCSGATKGPFELYDLTSNLKNKEQKLRAIYKAKGFPEQNQSSDQDNKWHVFFTPEKTVRKHTPTNIKLSNSSEYYATTGSKSGVPEEHTRRKMKPSPRDLALNPSETHAWRQRLKPPPDPSIRTTLEVKKHGSFQLNKNVGSKDISNSNSFGFFITNSDDEQEDSLSISSKVTSRFSRPNSYFHVKNRTTSPYVVYARDNIRQRRALSVIERKSPPTGKRYVTEIKLNLRKGRAQRVCKNWPPGQSDPDTVSEDHGEHKDSEDIRVKAILCRATDAADNQDYLSSESVGNLREEVIEIMTPEDTTKSHTESCGYQNVKLEKVTFKTGTSESLPSFSQDKSDSELKDVKHPNCGQMEMVRESGSSVTIVSHIGSSTSPLEPKFSMDTEESGQNDQLLAVSSTHTVAQTNTSPGTSIISPSMQQDLQFSHSKNQTSSPTLKKDEDWPNRSVTNADLNRFMSDMALNNIQSVLNEGDREQGFDERSVASGRTLNRSSTIDEPSIHTQCGVISTATVISPVAGKTSRGTQSEHLEQVKVVRDMQTQTGLADISEKSSSTDSAQETEIGRPHKDTPVRSPCPVSSIKPIVSKLPVPTNGFTRCTLLQRTGLDSNEDPRGKINPEVRKSIEPKFCASPSPSINLVLSPEQHRFKTPDSPYPIQPTFSSGRARQSPLSQGHTQTPAGLIQNPHQNTPPQRNLYRLVRENISSTAPGSDLLNNHPKSSLGSEEPNGTAYKQMISGKCEYYPYNPMDQRKSLTSRCQGDTAHEELHDGPAIGLINPLRVIEPIGFYKQGSAGQILASPRNGYSTPNGENKDVVFVERSSSQNSSQSSVIRRPVDAHDFPSPNGFLTNRYTANQNKPCLGTAGGHTIETCGCCRDGPCDCPTTSTLTGSQVCTCDYCQGLSVIGNSAHGVNCNQPDQQPRSFCRTAGDEGFLPVSTRYIGPGMSHVCNIVSDQTYEDATQKAKQTNLSHRSTSTRCSCCSESTITGEVAQEQVIQSRMNEPIQSRIQARTDELCGTSRITQTVYSNIPPGTAKKDDLGGEIACLSPCRENRLVNLKPGSSSFQVEPMGADRTDEEIRKRDELFHLNRVSCISGQALHAEQDSGMQNEKFASKQTEEYPRDFQISRPIEKSSQKPETTNPHIDNLFNLVGEKEKRNILQRWLLEQVAYSAKQNQQEVSEFKTKVDVKQVKTEEHAESGGSLSYTVSESTCTCSACEEAAVAPGVSRDSSGDHSSHFAASSTNVPGMKRHPAPRKKGYFHPPNQENAACQQAKLKSGERYPRAEDSTEQLPRPMVQAVVGRPPVRANSEGSLGQYGKKTVCSHSPRQKNRIASYRGINPPDSTGSSTLRPTLARNACDGVTDRKGWNEQHRLASQTGVDAREVTGRLMRNLGEVRNDRRNGSVLRETEEGRRVLNSNHPGNIRHPFLRSQLIPMQRAHYLQQHLQQPGVETRMQKVRRTNVFRGMTNEMRMFERNGTAQSSFGPVTMNRIKMSSTSGNGFDVERIFELNRYDDLVRSHLNVADRRIKAVALKNGCDIRISGPIMKADPSSICLPSRTKITYNCHIAGSSEESITKCVNFLKETFPNSLLRRSKHETIK